MVQPHPHPFRYGRQRRLQALSYHDFGYHTLLGMSATSAPSTLCSQPKATEYCTATSSLWKNRLNHSRLHWPSPWPVVPPFGGTFRLVFALFFIYSSPHYTWGVPVAISLICYYNQFRDMLLLSNQNQNTSRTQHKEAHPHLNYDSFLKGRVILKVQ